MLLHTMPSVAVIHLKMPKGALNTYKWRVRRKVKNARAFLDEAKRYRDVLYPKRMGER